MNIRYDTGMEVDTNRCTKQVHVLNRATWCCYCGLIAYCTDCHRPLAHPASTRCMAKQLHARRPSDSRPGGGC